jgi:glycosyltransferase involved in cell wall biosynthesis
MRNHGLIWIKCKKFFKKSPLSIETSSQKYERWIKAHEIQKNLTGDIQKKFHYNPAISIVMPVWNTHERWLHLAIQSVLNQSYTNWELCIADGKSTNPNIKKILDNYAEKDKRIKTVFLNENRGIAGNTNEALKLAGGSYICFLDHDDELSSNCLYEIVKLLNLNPDFDIIYSDNDKIDESGSRKDPFFKFDFSLPALLSTNYPFHLFLCRRSLIESVGGLRYGFEGSQDYDLILRVVEKTHPQKIAHIDKILYHWRTVRESSAHSSTAKPYAYFAGKLALEEYLVRNNIAGQVYELAPGSYQVKKEIPKYQDVLILVMTPNQKNEAFIHQFNSILEKTTYPVKKIFIPEIYENELTVSNIQTFRNNSSEYVKEICKTEIFNFLIFVSDEFKMEENFEINPEWIDALIEHFFYFNVGVVGTGSLVFSNIICNVERPCGPVFCTKRDQINAFLSHEHPSYPKDYDDFQIKLSDFSKTIPVENLYTPFSVGNIPQYGRISQYYSNFQSRKYFTQNMEFYLPSNLSS